MATLTTTIGATFTPAASDFIVQATGGSATLMRQNTSGAAFAIVGTFTGSQIVSNPVAAAVYKIVADPGVVIQADQ